jgi:hypothetical protein
VVIVQRFGSALNVNVHGHALVLDGVFAEDGAGALRVHPAPAGLTAASVQGRLALGPRPGAEVRRCGASPVLAASAPSVRGPCHAHRAGFDRHAGLVVPARDRARLERTCRYALRPPVAADRLRLTETGQVLLSLRQRWRDGATHLLFDPHAPRPADRGAGRPPVTGATGAVRHGVAVGRRRPARGLIAARGALVFPPARRGQGGRVPATDADHCLTIAP